jgi:hypothetical protein
LLGSQSLFKMVIKDEAGQRVSPEDLAARADRAAATKDGS